MRTIILGFCVALAIGPAFGDLLAVPGQHATLQIAIDAANDGDTVMVADGVYSGTGFRDIDLRGRAITVRSVNGPASCVIDLESVARGFLLRSGETTATRIEGLTIRNGSGDGAGIRFETGSGATIVDCVFRGHVGVDGAAARLANARTVFFDCAFESNTASNNGGAVMTGSEAVFVECRFEQNEARHGGAIYGAAGIEDCVFIENRATPGESTGGAVSSGQRPVVVTRSTFRLNAATGQGGAIYSLRGSLRLEDCVFERNEAPDGGAVWGALAEHVIADCDFIRNEASVSFGALLLASDNNVVERSLFRGNVGGMGGAAAFGGVARQCRFFGNESRLFHGGALVLLTVSAGPGQSDISLALDCTFSGNRAAFAGGALVAGGGTIRADRCVFNGNSAMFGGAVRNGSIDVADGVLGGNLRMLHNTFSGNHADCTGAAVVMGQLATITMSRTTVAHSLVVGNSAAGVDWMEPAAAIAKVTTQSPRLELYNTTVANNESPDAAAGVYNASAFNSLLWGNRGAAGETEAAQLSLPRALEHSCIQAFSGDPAAAGNTGGDPAFSRESTGMWTADATFDPNDFVVKLTNAGALWRPNTWAGAFVQPDINEPYMFQIITNNADTLTIWADWATASSGAARWTAGQQYRLADFRVSESSSCVDAGDNARARTDLSDIDADGDTSEFVPFDLAGEPRFVDILTRPDVGVTVEGYPEIIDIGAFEFQGCPNDLNGDQIIDLADLAILLHGYGRTRPVSYREGDVTGDGSVDLSDLAKVLATFGGSCD